MPDEIRHFVADANGGRYELHRPIGRGGQGAVYSCRGNPRIAIKLNHAAGEGQSEVLRQRLALVKRMDLEGLPISRPIAMLARPHVGYVMELISEMEPISRLLNPPSGAVSIKEWYRTTGGMRRRLRLLYRLARVLSSVHGRGLVYGDPSPGNVLVSKELESDDVYLIDSDNLRYSSRPEKGILFTPGYGAPELVLGHSGMNTLTDSHAFAVMAFHSLTLCHPLLGDAVLDGEPAMEEAAFQGQLPWIDHPSDDRNRCRHGIPRSMVLSKMIALAFEQAFGAGLNSPTDRPGMTSWVEALQSASRATIVCPSCGWSFYFTGPTCPECGVPRPSHAIATVGIWDLSESGEGSLCTGPNRRPLIVGTSVGTATHPLSLTREQLGLTNAKPDVALLVRIEGARIALSSTAPDYVMTVATTPGKPIRELTEAFQSFRLTSPGSSLYVHCAGLDVRHRVVRISVNAGAES